MVSKKQRTRVSDMTFDEVSVVDRGANEHSGIVLAKRADDEEDDLTALIADVLSKANDEYDDDEDVTFEDDFENYTDDEDEEFGKNFQPQFPNLMGQAPQAPAPGAPAPVQPGMAPPQAPVQPGMVPPQAPAPPQPQVPQVQLPPEVIQYIKALEQRVASQTQGGDQGDVDNPFQNKKEEGVEKMADHDLDFLDEIGKALEGDYDYDESVVASLQEISKRAKDVISKAEQRAAHAEEIAKAERDYRLNQEYILKAASLQLPGDPNVLGPIFKRMDESLPEEDVTTIVTILKAASDLIAESQDGQELFTEVGKSAGMAMGAAYDILDSVDVTAAEIVAKSRAGGHGVSHEQATVALFEQHPDLYDAYESEK